MKLKISTLFHWLYATLMFLPILMFIPSCLYYGFNEHATNTETTTITYKYQSNEVNSLIDLVEGNIYYLDTLEFEYQSVYFLHLDLNIYKCSSFMHSSNSDNLGAVTVTSYSNNDYNYINLFKEEENESLYSYFTNENAYIELYFDQFTITFQNVIFSVNNTLGDFKDLCTLYNYLPQYTDYNVIESVLVNTDDTITDKVATAWDRTWDLPLFAWTQNSFVAAPFSYITGLFGLGSDNSINYVFTYFVSISICWLVFDLIMYVPNLAHRWLDRSALE